MSTSERSVIVELGECVVEQDGKHKHTNYTFNFTIGEKKHQLIARYSVLRSEYEKLTKNASFQKAFNGKPPKFPSKGLFTDYTKPKNYSKRAKELLTYFESIITHPLVLKNELVTQRICF